MTTEAKRKVQFDNGTSLTVADVVAYSANDTTLSLILENGERIIVNPDRVLYHRITPKET